MGNECLMNVVIFHYHLNPGGVTRIIESQLSGLKLVKPDINLKIVCGHIADPKKYKTLGAELIIDENLNYLPEGLSKKQLDEKYDYLHHFFKAHVNKNDILHMHNVNLGKNPLITYVAYKLAKDGYKIVNHSHDFAEDRPQNWQFLSEIIENKFNENLQEILYPNIKNYLFTTLTIFDLHRLVDYDINCNRKHLLPNPVNLGPPRHKISRKNAAKTIRQHLNLSEEKKIFTYPVRVIQRKNIGEYILLATLFSNEAYWLVTQPPKNPKEIVKYKDWKDFCNSTQTEIYFEVGVNMDFDVLLAGSDACLTTSIREGFGMVYLEPWLSDTPVVGRNLEMVVQEFKNQGMKFPYLYNEIYVNVKGDILDFKDLSVNEQKEIILLAKHNAYKEEIFALNPNLKNILNVVSKELIEHNKVIITKHYSLEKFGERLYGIYKRFSE